VDYICQRRAYFRGLYVGKDGRSSTSKLPVLLWTYALLWALLSLVIAMWLGDDAGWKAQSDDKGLQSEYLILLGGPFAAAVAAKAITTAKVEDGKLPKADPDEAPGSVEGFKQVFSDDAGDGDLVDTQYFLFNLVALAYLVGSFYADVDLGSPRCRTCCWG
jgi:hypothetical protein